jgi:hypothetical protein
MRTLFIAALAALPVLVGVAKADEGRMSTTTYIRAAQCLALADLPALQADRPDMSALAARFGAERSLKPDDTKSRAQRAAARVTSRATKADTPAEVEFLKTSRDRLCSGFVATASVAQN